MTEEEKVVIIPETEKVVEYGSGMHPGVINGRRQYPLVNTSKPRSRKRLERAIEGWDKHIENHPRDGMAMKCRGNMQERLNGI